MPYTRAGAGARTFQPLIRLRIEYNFASMRIAHLSLRQREQAINDLLGTPEISRNSRGM